MQLTKDSPKFNFEYKKVEAILLNENKFITNLFSIIAFPQRYDAEQIEEDENVEEKPTKLPKLKGDKTSRASSIIELQKRLSEIQSKKKLTYKDKLQKKGLKNRMKKKSKLEDRNAQRKLLKAQKLNGTDKNIEDNVEVKPPNVKNSKPVYNSEGKMVFSKFDFSGLGKSKKEKKQEKDPKKILQNLQKQKEKLDKLEAEGETEKVIEIKEKSAWKNALAKAHGEKVKDDPELLKKSVKKHEQKQRQSKKKWDQRIENVQKAKDERQQKRTDNIEKRKKDKKNHKLKKAVKKGKVIPGF